MNDHLEDIRSDMSALHRVDDLEAMPASRFFAFVDRLPAYQGVLRARAEKEQQDNGAPTASSAPKRTFDDARQNPELAPYIEGL